MVRVPITRDDFHLPLNIKSMEKFALDFTIFALSSIPNLISGKFFKRSSFKVNGFRGERNVKVRYVYTPRASAVENSYKTRHFRRLMKLTDFDFADR